MKEKDSKKKIELIEIIILIVVVIACIVLLLVSINTPLNKANDELYKSDFKNLVTELKLYVENETKNGKDMKEINGTNKELVEYMPSIKNKTTYKEILVVKEGKLYLISDNIIKTDKEKITKWAKEAGIEEITKYGSDKPYIPNGFEHIEGTIKSGFVIKDQTIGNEFVWIPVSNIADIKLTDFPKANIQGSEIITDIIHSSIETYGGFYIARYEQGIGNTSKKGNNVWNNINWNDSLNNSNNMYNTKEIGTSLIYGAMWDVTSLWLENMGYNVTSDSTSWGNYSNNKTSGEGSKQVAGYSESWKSGNIYDFAGNVSEWTQELGSNENRIIRSGNYTSEGFVNPAVNRINTISSKNSDNIGFRTILHKKL